MDFPWMLAVPVGLTALLLLRRLIRLLPLPIIKTNPALPGRGWQLIYEDAHLLYDEHYKLKGKPDMVYRKGRKLIPVELKSGRIGKNAEPRFGDLMQLAAYFILVEAEWGIKPVQGRLIYSDGMFLVANTRALRRRLAETLSDMEYMLESPDGFEAEPGFSKCKYCPCQGTVCEFSYSTSRNNSST
jgi:CRISPR-associated exonuclease Cas4